MDKEFFTAQIEMCADMLYRIAWSCLRSEADVQDAVQEAILKAWEKRERLREPAYFRTWITRILINVCHDMQRKRSRVALVEEFPADVAAEAPDPDLAMALQGLPEKLRLPLVLCLAEGMTYEEAAKALHLPVSTVRGRIHRGKMLLRKELEA